MRLFALLFLAFVAISGTARAQVSCTPTLSPAGILRAEGLTEPLPVVYLTCSNTALAGDTPTFSLRVHANVPITSFAGVGFLPSEATISALGTLYSATVEEETGDLLFTSVNLTPDPAGAPFFVVALSGIRVDATGLALNVGDVTGYVDLHLTAYPDFTKTHQGTLFNASNVLDLMQVAEARRSLAVVVRGPNVQGQPVDDARLSISQCAANAWPDSGAPGTVPHFWVSLRERYSGAFHSLLGEVGNSELYSGFGTGTATNGTRFMLAFANVPNGVDLWVPSMYNDGTTIAVLMDQPSSIGAGGSPATDAYVRTGAMPVFYEVIATTPGTPSSMDIPVYVAYTALPDPTTNDAPFTVSANYAPFGLAGYPTLTRPAFAIAPIEISGVLQIAQCYTTLLFPWLSTTDGADSGVAFANTQMRPGGETGATGVCTMYFYGTPSAVAPVETPPVAPGTVWSAQLSTLGIGDFSGYMIAQCNFLRAHGYAQVFTPGPGAKLLMSGYLALVLGTSLAPAPEWVQTPESVAH